jgi:hypothetical protein
MNELAEPSLVPRRRGRQREAIGFIPLGNELPARAGIPLQNKYAETGRPKSPPETTAARRDQKKPERIAEIPAQGGLSEPDWKLPGLEGLNGGVRSQIRTGLRLDFPATGKITGNFAISGLLGATSVRKATVPQRFPGKFPATINREIIFDNREISHQNREIW